MITKKIDMLQKLTQRECSIHRWNLMVLLLTLLLMLPTVSSKVFAQTSSDGSSEPEILTTANSTLICPANIDDTIRHGGCNLKLSIGVPTFSTNTSLPMSEITISNNAPADSIYPVGETVVRWVAKNLSGDSVFCDQIVKVSFQPCPDAVDYEGTIYQAVRLGNGCKCWTTTNLRSTKYSDGRQIEDVMSCHSYEYPNTTENVDIFGHLYNWYAAVDTGRYGSVDSVERAYNMGHRIQGVCPDGWYLPSDEEYDELNIYPSEDLRSTNYWIDGANNTNATGFNSLPGGIYNCVNGRYENIMGNAYYWTCHPVYDMATGAMIDYVCEKIVLSSDSRCSGFSVRCVYDEGGSSTAATLPTVTTAAVTNVTAITVTFGGNVTADGGAPVTARGVCWALHRTPDMSNNHTTDGSGTGSFFSSLSNLSEGTTYYVRAYATNSVGTAYGEEVCFTTEISGYLCPVQTIVTDADNQNYNTVLIGSQCWMKENLRTTKYADGTDIPVANYFNYNTSVIPLDQRGLLYNWKAVMNGASFGNATLSGVQGVCPTGWHVPSDVEWSMLEKYVSGSDWQTSYETYYGYRGSHACKLASNDFIWGNSALPNTPGYNQANNKSRFSAVPAGYNVNNSYDGENTDAHFWSSTQSDNDSAWVRSIVMSDAGVSRQHFHKTQAALSVRCIRDEGAVTTPTVTTSAVSNVTATTATCGGNVIGHGGAFVTACGVCWSTTQNPTIADAYTTDNQGWGVFSSSITGLTSGTTYYVRAYATNSVGTVYGDEVSFTTP